MAIIAAQGVNQYPDNNGDPLAGGKLYTYAAGTTTPKLTWSNAAESVANANPIILDSAGRATIFWSGNYKIELRTSADVVLWTIDFVNIVDDPLSLTDLADTANPALGDASVGTKRTESGAVATTVHQMIQASVLNALVFDATIDKTGATDVSTKLQAFIDACEASGFTGYIPAGTYDVSTMLVNDVGIEVCGQRYKTILRRHSGATIASILHVGPTSSTTPSANHHWHDITFEGNGGCTDAVVKVRNIGYSTFERLLVKSGSAVGFKSDTSTDSASGKLNYNTYDKIESQVNTGTGILFIGEKDATFGALLTNGNGGDGIEFRGWKYDGGTSAETTECTVASLNCVINTGSGVIFNQCEKYTVACIETHHNEGWGTKFKGTVQAASGNGGNNVNIGVLTSRNDQLGGIACLLADDGIMNAAIIGTALLIGYGSALNSKGLHLQGAAFTQFGRVTIVGFPGNAVTIEAGTPLNVAGESNNLIFGSMILSSNGNASSSNNHGLSIQGSSSKIEINSLISENPLTTGTDYELVASNTSGPILIGQAILTPNAAANGIASTTATMEIGILKIGSGPIVHAIRDGVTAPSASVSKFAQIYIDTSDGDLKIRFEDGTVKTIVVDT